MVMMLDAAAVRGVVDWPGVVDALAEGLAGPPPALGDVLLSAGERRFLVRAATVEGAGWGIKAVTVYPDNPRASPPRPSVQGLFVLYDEATGAPAAAIDGAEITVWKTAGDSALGARLLAREDARTLLMVGAGTMSEPLVRAHLAVRPGIERVMVWNRTRPRAEALAGRLSDTGRAVAVAGDLAAAVGEADVVSCATMSAEPVVRGAWLKAGAHLDLVGAYTPTMREADDEALTRGRLFVDSRATTIGEIGELVIPMAAGVIGEEDVLADFHDLLTGTPGRTGADEITVFKNGGGAHLDLIVARHIVERAGG